MENQTGKSNKKAIIIVVVILVALFILGTVGIVLSKTFLYRQMFKFLNNNIVSALETGKDDFAVTIKGNASLVENEENKDIASFLNKVEFKLSLQSDKKDLVAAIEAKDRNSDEKYLDATVDAMIQKNGLYLKCDQLAEEWIDLLDNQEIKEKYLELKGELDTENEKEELDKKITEEIIKDVIDDISSINVVKSKEQYEYRGKPVKATKNSLCIEKSRIENLLLKVMEKYEEENDEDEINNAEEMFTALGAIDFNDDDFDKYFDDDEDDYYDYDEDEDEDEDEEDDDDDDIEEITDYEYFTINFYTKGWLRKKIIGVSTELMYCEEGDALDCDCEEKSYKEAEVRFIEKSDDEYDIIYSKYDLNKIKDQDFREEDCVIEKVSTKIIINNERNYTIEIEVEKDGILYATCNLEIMLNHFEGEKEEIIKDKTVSINSISIDKLMDTKLFAEINSIKDADQKVEAKKEAEIQEQKQKEQSEVEAAAKQLEESTKEVTRQINNSAFEMLKGENVSFNNVNVIIEMVNQVNSLRNAGVTVKVDGELVSTDAAKEKINIAHKYNVSLEYNESEEVSGVVINTVK